MAVVGGIKRVGVFDRESVCVFVRETCRTGVERQILTLTEGEKYTKCACVIPMPAGK